MLQIIAKPVRKILNSFGYEIVKQESILSHMQASSWLEKLNISTIIDIGSNEGQFIKAITHIIKAKNIYAFEPIRGCYDKMVSNTQGLNVTPFNCGLSDTNGTSEINISENFVSSSILDMEALHKNLYPESKYVKKETIELKRLDDALAGKDLQKNVLLKIDVQGYENKVIAGGAETIKKADVVIIEYSYEPIYEGQWLFGETYNYFTTNGFKFVGISDQTASAKTGIPIFGDAIFIRKELAKLAY